MSIHVTCRNCGNKAPSDQFKLDYKVGYVVCPNCFAGNRKGPIKGPRDTDIPDVPAEAPSDFREKATVKKRRPAGWDAEDELLLRLHEQRQGQVGSIERVGDDRFKYSCAKCSYSFTFKEEKRPKTCPYCDTTIILKPAQ